MANTIFYSWQSDTPNSTNRNFIEDAIKKAIKQINREAELIPAIRDSELIFDKDTLNVPGTVPVFQTILDKIGNCAVFIGDFTYVGAAETIRDEKDGAIKKRTPNPNVAIEYGYALKSIGGERIILIMNTSFGEPNKLELPFNVIHVTWPIRYSCSVDEAEESRIKSKKNLVKTLKTAIEGSLSKYNNNVIAKEYFIPAASYGKDISLFATPGSAIVAKELPGRTNSTRYIVPAGNNLFLRLMPKYKVEPIQHSIDLEEILTKANIPAMGCSDNSNMFASNEFGACSYSYYPDMRTIYNITQVFHSKEIWGIEQNFVFLQPIRNSRRKIKILNLEKLEKNLEETFNQYLQFYTGFLKIDPPYQFKTGITNIRNCMVHLPNGFRRGFNDIEGDYLSDIIEYECDINDLQVDIRSLLKPFYIKLLKDFQIRDADDIVYRQRQ